MLDHLIKFVLGADLTTPYTILVWIAAILAVALMALTYEDPANRFASKIEQQLRRVGMLVLIGGLLSTVLFGGSQGWTPWPPMILVVLGLDLHLAGVIMSVRCRVKIGHSFWMRAAARQNIRIG